MSKEYDLERFVEAHKYSYHHALEEMRRGRKQTHWIWFIFPQLKHLGRSYNARYYGIADIGEARAYLAHPLLGTRLREICAVILSLEGSDPLALMGSPDDMKLRSSMTLFAKATDDNEVFLAVLDKYYGGAQDPVTLGILENE